MVIRSVLYQVELHVIEIVLVNLSVTRLIWCPLHVWSQVEPENQQQSPTVMTSAYPHQQTISLINYSSNRS